MRKLDTTTLLMVAGAAALLYFVSQQQAQATPLSIYPSLAWTGQTSMAATPRQKAATAAIPPTSFFTSTQGQEQQALLTQCAGAYPGCTVMMPDTQLGF